MCKEVHHGCGPDVHALRYEEPHKPNEGGANRCLQSPVHLTIHDVPSAAGEQSKEDSIIESRDE
jgi:hypothetical protein